MNSTFIHSNIFFFFNKANTGFREIVNHATLSFIYGPLFPQSLHTQAKIRILFNILELANIDHCLEKGKLSLKHV